VIATTSSSKKAEILKKLGADHIINYKEEPNWGEKAKALTPGGEGIHHVVEVGGPTTMAQSLKAIKIDGVITIIGFLGGFGKDQPTFLEVLVGSLKQGALLRFLTICRTTFAQFVVFWSAPGFSSRT